MVAEPDIHGLGPNVNQAPGIRERSAGFRRQPLRETHVTIGVVTARDGGTGERDRQEKASAEQRCEDQVGGPPSAWQTRL